MDSLNTLDLGIIGLISVSAIFGVMRGFVKESMSLVTWITAMFIATVYCSTVANHLSVISLVSLRYLVAFLLLILATLIVGGLISHWVSRLITLTGFSVTDRIVGTLFGVIRGVLIIAIALLVTENAVFAQQNPLFQQSVLIPSFKPVAAAIKKSLPEDLLHKLLGPNLDSGTSKLTTLPTQIPSDFSNPSVLQAKPSPE